MKKLTIYMEKCIGCHSCELACSSQKEGIFKPSVSRIQVIEDLTRSITINNCQFCEGNVCVEVCPREAITIDSDNWRVLVDSDKCIGCGICVEECPHKSIKLHPQTDIALICDRCDGSPACAQACTEGAICWEDEA